MHKISLKRLIGYAPVSTYGETLEAQLAQLRAAGCSSRNISRDEVTGTRADRRELHHILGKLTPGDVVKVTRIDRLPGSTFDLFCIAKRIVDAKAQSDHWPSRGPTLAPAPGGL